MTVKKKKRPRAKTMVAAKPAAAEDLLEEIELDKLVANTDSAEDEVSGSDEALARLHKNIRKFQRLDAMYAAWHQIGKGDRSAPIVTIPLRIDEEVEKLEIDIESWKGEDLEAFAGLIAKNAGAEWHRTLLAMKADIDFLAEETTGDGSGN